MWWRSSSAQQSNLTLFFDLIENDVMHICVTKVLKKISVHRYRWALMHEVVADVVEELLGAAGAGAAAGAAAAPASEGAAAADAWLLVSELGAQPYRDNSVGAQSMKL